MNTQSSVSTERLVCADGAQCELICKVESLYFATLDTFFGFFWIRECEHLTTCWLPQHVKLLAYLKHLKSTLYSRPDLVCK